MSARVLGRGTHGWLQRDDLVVDVTADQFGQPPIIVATNSTWHKMLNAEVEQMVADYEAFFDGADEVLELREADRLIRAFVITRE